MSCFNSLFILNLFRSLNPFQIIDLRISSKDLTFLFFLSAFLWPLLLPLEAHHINLLCIVFSPIAFHIHLETIGFKTILQSL